MFVLELRVLPVLRRSPEGSGAPMDFADGMIHRTSSLSVSYLGALYWSLYLNTPSRVSPVSRFLVTYSGLPRINISLQRW